MNKSYTPTYFLDACIHAKGLSFTCGVEITLAVSISLVAAQEFLQMYALGVRRYLQEFENMLELIVIALATASVFCQWHMNAVKWVSAFGICLAYLELIFLLGR